MTAAAAAAATADNVDIVVRDQNGGYRIDVPILPHSIAVDDGDGAGMEGTDSAEGDAKISEREKESMRLFFIHIDLYRGREQTDGEIEIEASLVEMMYRSRNRQMSNEPSGKFIRSSYFSFHHPLSPEFTACCILPPFRKVGTRQRNSP